MWTDGNGFFYEGDCRSGDRAATDAEVAAYNAARANPLPDRITPVQMRLQLRAAGKTDALNTLLAQPGNEEAHDRWLGAVYFERTHPLTQSLGQALGLDVDQFFRDAAKID